MCINVHESNSKNFCKTFDSFRKQESWSIEIKQLTIFLQSNLSIMYRYVCHVWNTKKKCWRYRKIYHVVTTERNSVWLRVLKDLIIFFMVKKITWIKSVSEIYAWIITQQCYNHQISINLIGYKYTISNLFNTLKHLYNFINWYPFRQVYHFKCHIFTF